MRDTFFFPEDLDLMLEFLLRLEVLLLLDWISPVELLRAMVTLLLDWVKDLKLFWWSVDLDLLSNELVILLLFLLSNEFVILLLYLLSNELVILLLLDKTFPFLLRILKHLCINLRFLCLVATDNLTLSFWASLFSIKNLLRKLKTLYYSPYSWKTVASAYYCCLPWFLVFNFFTLGTSINEF